MTVGRQHQEDRRVGAQVICTARGSVDRRLATEHDLDRRSHFPNCQPHGADVRKTQSVILDTASGGSQKLVENNDMIKGSITLHYTIQCTH